MVKVGIHHGTSKGCFTEVKRTAAMDHLGIFSSYTFILNTEKMRPVQQYL